MSYPIRAKDLRIKLFRSNTNKDLESKVNTWLSNCEEEFEVIDVTFERYFNPVTENVVTTAIVVFRIV
ncbi:MAG TPA: sporulation protein Cse60 [Dehalococcoidia bacterium]|nr:sporulation protein Cse60 [Dehalococcoidia bacterium]